MSSEALFCSLMLERLPVACAALYSSSSEQRVVLGSPSALWHSGVGRHEVGGGKQGGLRLDLPPLISYISVRPPACLAAAPSAWLPD